MLVGMHTVHITGTAVEQGVDPTRRSRQGPTGRGPGMYTVRTGLCPAGTDVVAYTSEPTFLLGHQ